MSLFRAGCGSLKAALLWPQPAKGSGTLNMMPAPTVCATAILSMVMFGAACSRPAPESRIKSVEARIDGLTCPTCVPPLTASLKQQYGKSAIEVDDDKDTATIHFAENDNFSAADFRAAVARVRMRVLTLRVQACGNGRDGGRRQVADGGRHSIPRAQRPRIAGQRADLRRRDARQPQHAGDLPGFSLLDAARIGILTNSSQNGEHAMSGLQRAAVRTRYLLGAAVGASVLVSQIHPDALGAFAIHGRLVRMDPLPPDICVWPAAVQWAEQAAGRAGTRVLAPCPWTIRPKSTSVHRRAKFRISSRRSPPCQWTRRATR